MIVLKCFNLSRWQTMLKIRNVFHTIISSRALQGKHAEEEAKKVAVKASVKTAESSRVVSQRAVQSDRNHSKFKRALQILSVEG